jgi:hypothetical protein
MKNLTLLTEAPSSQRVPNIVPVILAHVARQRRDGDLTAAAYDEKLSRLKREELGPRGFVLLETPLAGGCTRYLIKEGRTGTIRESVDCGATW